MANQLTPEISGHLMASRTLLEETVKLLDRADDGVFRMLIGVEGRQRALWNCCLAIDKLEKLKSLLSQVPIFGQGEM